MENIENIMSILTFCVWAGILVLCIVLVIGGILRWISAEDAKRSKRLNILSWIAFIVLCIIFLVCNWTTIDGSFTEYSKSANEKLSFISVDVSKITIKLLILGVVVLSAAMLLLFIIFCMYKAVKLFLSPGNDLAGRLEEKSKEFKRILKTRIAIYVVVWGIIAVFAILPLLVTNSKSENMSDAWVGGIQRIASFGNTDTDERRIQDIEFNEDKSKTPVYSDNEQELIDSIKYKLVACIKKLFLLLDSENLHFEDEANNPAKESRPDLYNNLISYFLIFVIILGVGYAVIKILISIMENTFKDTSSKNLIDEYSGSMGVLAVGIALLHGFKSIDFGQAELSEIIAACGTSFIIVCFIVAIAILALEIIRLLMDMREKLIRQEARYLFISLVGHATLLLTRIAASVYGAVNTIIGNPSNSNELEKVQERLEGHMIQSMYEHIDDNVIYEMTFSGFDRTVTKK